VVSARKAGSVGGVSVSLWSGLADNFFWLRLVISPLTKIGDYVVLLNVDTTAGPVGGSTQKEIVVLGAR
jgi:hypothetical protein